MSEPLSTTSLVPYDSPIVGSTGYVSLRSLQSTIVSRFLFASQFGFNTQFNGKRDLNLIFGYDNWIDPGMYRYEYERGGIAKRIVEIFPRATWANRFDIVDDENLKRQTQFERGIDVLKKEHNLHQILIRASILAHIYHYSVIYIGAPGDPESELPRGTSLKNIAYFYPLGEDKAKVESVVGQIPGEELFNPRYGMPEYYQINLGRSAFARDGSSYSGYTSQVAPSFSRRVHWSRVIHIVRDPLDNELYSTPILQFVWNLLHDLKKLTGGLSEAALRRGWPGLHANIDKESKITPEKAREEIGGQLDEYNVGLRNAITTRGVEIGELAVKGGISLKENIDAIMQQIAAVLGVPKQVFEGSERGMRSSGNDRTNFWDRVTEIRPTHNEKSLRELFSRLSTYGYLASPKNPDYSIIWPQEDEMTEPEKVETASEAVKSGVMTVDESRDKYLGMGPKPKETPISNQGDDTSATI